ncbi:MAG TPA: hypothetical protein VMT20_09490 [Terriglobia bacterium]|nr:hypothetical protein [Terriglobia bacterium]
MPRNPYRGGPDTKSFPHAAFMASVSALSFAAAFARIMRHGLKILFFGIGPIDEAWWRPSGPSKQRRCPLSLLFDGRLGSVTRRTPDPSASRGNLAPRVCSRP